MTALAVSTLAINDMFLPASSHTIALAVPAPAAYCVLAQQLHLCAVPTCEESAPSEHTVLLPAVHCTSEELSCVIDLRAHISLSLLWVGGLAHQARHTRQQGSGRCCRRRHCKPRCACMHASKHRVVLSSGVPHTAGHKASTPHPSPLHAWRPGMNLSCVTMQHRANMHAHEVTLVSLPRCPLTLA